MRSRMIAFAAAVVVAFSASAYAQATIPAATDLRGQALSAIDGRPYGNIDFGGQFSDITGDKARYQRYRDLRDAPLLDNFLFSRRGQDWTFKAQASKIGYRDQGFDAEYRMPGKVKVNFVWSQVPLFYSTDTRSLYSEASPGVFRLPDAMQAANEAGATTVRTYLNQATGFDLRSTRDTGAFDLIYTANRDTDLKFNVTSWTKTGSMPWMAPFGFSNVVELGLPLDQRTTDAKAMLEWSNQNGYASVGWDGSWFNNNIETLVWDNPLKITDANYSSAYSDGKGSSQGRMALWPDSTLQYVHGTAGVSTPGRGRLTAYLALGDSKQNADLLPHTINSSVPPIPLPRSTAEAEIRYTTLNVQYAARPIPEFALNARYRYNDRDNRTPHFEPGARVRFDGVYDAPGGEVPTPEPYSVKRGNFDVDGTISALKYTSIKVGYGYADTDRTFRIWEKTKEHTFRVAADTAGNQYVSLRAVFEKAKREGDGWDEELLDEVGEQPGMQHFDVADRDRKRFNLITTLTPSNVFGVTLSAGIGREEYPNSEFGLQKYDTDQYSVGFDVIPNDRVGLNMVYAWENYTSVTASRTANPLSATDQTFLDPRRNWFMDYDGKVKNFDASLDLVEIAPKIDVNLGLNWSDATDGYNYRLAANTVLATPAPLPQVVNELLRNTVELTYKVSHKFHVAGGYWYENYKVQDFALGDKAITQLFPATGSPTTLLLDWSYRPYRANTGFARLTYLW